MSISYTVFRRLRDGKKARRYSIRLRMPDGRTQDRVGYTDKAATLQKASQLVRDLERQEVGLHDAFGKWRRISLVVHLDAFLVALEAGNLGRRRSGGRPAPEYVVRVRKRLLALFAALGATRLEQLDQVKADHVLAEGVRGGWSDKTRDDHAAILRQFGAWLVDVQRWPSNPFHRLRAVHTQASSTFERGPLTLDELVRLVAAAEVRPAQELRRVVPGAKAARLARVTADGAERGLLYLLTAYTGLRRREVTSLRWADLHLAAPEPHLIARAVVAKNRITARLDIPEWLAGRLRDLQRRRSAEKGGPPAPTSTVFHVSYRHLMDRMRLDLVFADLGSEQAFRVGGQQRTRIVDGSGRVKDFHALRGAYATMLAELGVPERVAKDLMRHSDVRLTFETYALVRSQLGRTAVDQLPVPPGFEVPKEQTYAEEQRRGG